MRHFARFVCVALTLCVFVAPTTFAQRPAPNLASTPLRDKLNPDGSLNLNGSQGSLDPSGYRLRIGPGGAPRFVPQAAGDEQWDDRFGIPGLNGNVTTMAVAPNGDLYVGGNFDQAGGLDAKRIARWDGRRWYALGAGLDDIPTQIAVNETSLYVVSGFLQTAGGTSVHDIARWDIAAATWSRVGNGVGPQKVTSFTSDGNLYAVALIGDDMYVGGNFNRIDGVAANSIARWNGSTWSALGDGIGILDFENNFSPEGYVYAITPSGNDLYVGGEFSVAGGQSANSIAHWNGSAWSALGAGLSRTDTSATTTVQVITVAGDALYVGGRFDNAGGQPAANIARWSGSAWSALGDGVAGDTFSSDPTVRAIAIADGSVYAGGPIRNAGGQQALALARWNGTAWDAPALGFDQFTAVNALTLGPDGLMIGGNFFSLPSGRVNYIVRWDGEAHSVGFGLELGEIDAVTTDADGRVFIGGRFNNAAGVKATNLAMWDGLDWYDIGGTDDAVNSLLVADGILYVAGNFTKAGTISAQHIASYNISTNAWANLGSGINGEVNALASDGGVLYAGGGFTAAGGVAAFDLAWWDGAAWHAFGDTFRIYERSQEGGEIGTFVSALAVDNGRVYVGGHFQTLHQIGTSTIPVENYQLVNNVASWEPASDTWFLVGRQTATEEPGVTSNGNSGFMVDVYALAVIGDNLYIGGVFNQAGTAAVGNLARWNLAAGGWSAIGGGVGGPGTGALSPAGVRALAAAGTELYVGGNFASAGNTNANRVAHYDTIASTWATLGSGINGSTSDIVYALDVSDEAVTVGGSFGKAGLVVSGKIARWEAPQTGGLLGTEGGVITGPDGTTVTLPDGALSEQTYVVYTELFKAPAAPPVGFGAVRSFRVQAQNVAGQPLDQFAKPVTVRVPYNDAELAALDISDIASLAVVRWNGSTWETLPATAQVAAAGNVSITTTKTGDFALVGKIASVGGTRVKLYLPLVLK